LGYTPVFLLAKYGWHAIFGKLHASQVYRIVCLPSVSLLTVCFCIYNRMLTLLLLPTQLQRRTDELVIVLPSYLVA